MRKLIFPFLTVVFLVLMLVSDYYPQWFAAGTATEFFAAAVICVVLSFLAFLYA